MTAEAIRLAAERARAARWYRWGPYVSERQWGTVREDYSAGGDAWQYLPHDHARSRAYRWGEDGIGGLSDNHQRLCLAVALWNGRDPILKERLFGLAGPEGNHGEDVKECYYYLDNLPSHAYMKMLYKYPQAEFPYTALVDENKRRSKEDPEYELLDTGVFERGYFDVVIEYAKDDPEDILCRIEVTNRGTERAAVHVLPTLWFRNTWSWSIDAPKPRLSLIAAPDASDGTISADHWALGTRYYHCEKPAEVVFTENETNNERLFRSPNATRHVKDGIDSYIVRGDTLAVNPERTGTKAAAHYLLDLEPGASKVVRVRLTEYAESVPFDGFDEIVTRRREEADDYYNGVLSFPIDDDLRNIQRQAFAGMLWSKQYYHYSVHDWLEGDKAQPAPPVQRRSGRNHQWVHLYCEDILSMPDAWEYPWFAAWDLAFHCIPFALIDSHFAKQQLLLLTREWYMHPNGQLPAYEWDFGDVNPPVHAWAAHRVYQIDRKMNGTGDTLFLERVFQKLLLNFTWWVNRKDAQGKNVFAGGFLGLDNIGVFDRSAPLPNGGYLDQSDGTSWMAFYSLSMLGIALELAKTKPAYEDIASKFFEHFLYISAAMNRIGGADRGLWDPDDGFYYDYLHLPGGEPVPLRVRSMVGLIPLLAVEVVDGAVMKALPNFARRVEWFIENRPDLSGSVMCMRREGIADRRILSVAGPDKIGKILQRMLDPNEFLGRYGLRALSRIHATQPFRISIDGTPYAVGYEPAESRSNLFGGNSNWRGPVWFPLNYLIVEALQKYHHYYGDELRFEMPHGSGAFATLWEIATDISHRLIATFARDDSGRRPVFGSNDTLQTDPNFAGDILFHEYFNGDTGAGLGAGHQTGWTGLVAKLIQQCAEYCGQGKSPLDRQAATPTAPLLMNEPISGVAAP
jgi:hypothetical protein